MQPILYFLSQQTWRRKKAVEEKLLGEYDQLTALVSQLKYEAQKPKRQLGFSLSSLCGGMQRK